jgi:two-component system response regulator FixJ
LDKTIAIVNQDNLARFTTAALVQSAGYRVQTFASAADYLSARLLKTPDCVVLDIQGTFGLDPLRVMAGRHDSPPAVVTCAGGSIALAVEAMKLGASDCLEKPYGSAALLEAIERSCLASYQKRDAAAAASAAVARVEPLSLRQRQVLRGIAIGQPNKIIAFELGLSIRTVEAYRAQLLEKLGVRSTAEAIRVAVAAGLHADGEMALACSAR